MNVCIKRI